MIKPIKYLSSLAGNPPLKTPHFYYEITWEGEKKILSDPQALRGLISVMDMHAVLGGAACHYGGPAAFAELGSVVYSHVFEQAQKEERPWFELFNIVNDAGHCENLHYAIKANYQFSDLSFEDLFKFRSIESPLTGHGECHLFPEGVLLSNGPLGSSFPQSQGLALGDALAHNERVTISFISDGALMEGEAKESLAAIPGFAKKGQLAPYLLIVSDNNTKLTGRIDSDSFSLAPTLKSLTQLGWRVLELENGNNIEACYQAFQKGLEFCKKDSKQPVVIWAKTLKGIGHKKSETSPSGGHGFSIKSVGELKDLLNEIFHNKQVPLEFNKWIEDLEAKELSLKSKKLSTNKPREWSSLSQDKVQVGVSKALIEAVKKQRPIISVTSDLPGSTGLSAFRKEFPHHSIDVGVAESNMISTAVGLSKMGYIPIVDTFAQFGVTKGALPFIMSSLSQAPLIGVFSHIGFQDAADGASHQALNYFSMLLGIPHVEVWSLATAQEAEFYISQAIEEFYNTKQLGKTPPSYVFFLGRENFPIENPHFKPVFRSSSLLYENEEATNETVVLCVNGTLVNEALNACYQLTQEGYGVILIHAGYITEPDWTFLGSYLKKAKGRIVFSEDHQLRGGFSSHWAQSAYEQKIFIDPIFLGVRGHFGQSAYLASELYEKHGIGSRSMYEAVKNLSLKKS